MMCPDCSGTGRVPDVEATLRAEVARLTEEMARKDAAFDAHVAVTDQISANAIRVADENARLTAELADANFARATMIEGCDSLGNRLTAARAENARLTAEVERLSQREPTQQECDAAEGKPDATGKTWPAGEAFIGQTCRRCIDCGRWAFGGPTRCLYCAGKHNVGVAAQMYLDDLRAANAEIERLKAECETRHAHEVALENEKLRMYDEHSRLVRVANDEAHNNAAWWRAEVEKRDAEVERLKGRERQSMALLNAVRSSEFDGVIRDDIARTEGVEGMFDPNRPEQDALNWVAARAAWLAGCKS